jgi:hypothetical protein
MNRALVTCPIILNSVHGRAVQKTYVKNITTDNIILLSKKRV